MKKVVELFPLNKKGDMKYKFEKPIYGKIGTEKYAVNVKWRNGAFISDEPEKFGGKDLGPDPFTLLLSSLAACTLGTLKMYIAKKGWDISEVTINVNMFQIIKEGRITSTIDRDISFSASTTMEQREKLLEIADNCPVSLLLKGDLTVRTYFFNEDTNEKKINYTNGAITVAWKPDVCKHSGRCIFGLPKVFNINKQPWISMGGATTDAIKTQVEKCPTGALTWYDNSAEM